MSNELLKQVSGEISNQHFVEIWNQEDKQLVIGHGEERSKTVLESLHKAAKMGNALGLSCAELLYETRVNRYYEDLSYEDEDGEEAPYHNFDDYVRRELGMEPRKAYLLAQFFETFVINCKVPTEVVAELPYSKAMFARNYITEENWPEVVEQIKGNTIEELKDWLKKEDPETAADERNKRLVCNLSESMWESVSLALQLAEKDVQTSDRGQLLSFICADFIGGQVSGNASEDMLGRLKRILDIIEDVFQVTIHAEVKSTGVKLYEGAVDTETKEQDLPDPEMDPKEALGEIVPVLADGTNPFEDPV